MSAQQYVIVSPVKDEERYVELTLKSVADQTLKPVLWVIVDDGSSDGTPEILERYAGMYPFIRLVRHERDGVRQPGSAVIRAFNRGCAETEGVPYDFIVKLDCDLSFGPDYFEKLLGRFRDNGRLGIASGVYLERDGAGSWNEVMMPSYHAAGASKVMRRQCFESIGGLPPSPGWDTVDEVRAMALGWQTGHFRDLRMKHHKAEGSGIGSLKTSRMHGEIYYRTGGGKLFFFLKVLHRSATKPYALSALALLWGYLKASFERRPLLVSPEEARCYRDLLNDRLSSRMKRSPYSR